VYDVKILVTVQPVRAVSAAATRPPDDDDERESQRSGRRAH
jgi:hypothetical protein